MRNRRSGKLPLICLLAFATSSAAQFQPRTPMNAPHAAPEVHILDYKPDARKETHAHVQITIYALALARRVGLPLKVFKCGWFDEKDYFEFYPLQVVYKRGMTRSDLVAPLSGRL